MRSAVSDYSSQLLNQLKGRYRIDVYHDASYLPYIGLQSPEFGCYDYRLFERNTKVLGYHALLYQMGNSPHHGYMYETLLRHPGVVTLHDLNLVNFHCWYARQPSVDGRTHLLREFEAFCGAGAQKALHSLAAFVENPDGFQEACNRQGYHLNGQVFEYATAVIVHSPSCVEQVQSRLPIHAGKAAVVPFVATALDLSSDQREANQSQRWSSVADAYEQVIERTVRRRIRPMADNLSVVPALQVSAPLEWLPAAS